ncbi:TPA: molybdenum cofactor biosynthesis protein [Photobacterium damselae]|uniref:Molybdenum cofactor biosynthesis protein n=5 Tax=Photobacterium damselae TaxID=38293 RepID=A0ABD6X8A4_PHODM|nr:molybdenum cofactor biosynthesis protein [Photobacterium damselae]EJN6959115.1 molybdenum cofactor biosynthesis protein [Photobacterium damselae]KAB1505804.1 molybdenum cofactor biosynthesis protein [Photobacterium damselae subsp. damselae]MCG3816232.1 molybdenum cofactor biosynthesis protein [Photobacterium damselae]MCG9777389.1 molybdenum cofactor biosynthesis protein [Photobacterium damselae]OBU44028.1 molybdenum cofactor biosynthesis protein [Photobacterium damselae]
MDVKKSWGFASIAIGMLSLIWGCISLSGMVGQEQVFADMSHFVQFSDSQLISKSMEQSLAAARHKNFIVLLTGLIMSLVGAMMIKGRFQRF